MATNPSVDNLRIWKIGEQTDPAHTREAKPFGKVITAIDSYYQIKRATDAFGPIGIGWGYTAVEKEVFMGDQVQAVVKVSIWYIEPGDTLRRNGPEVIASNPLKSDKGRVDEEAYKKATTDGITKALSYLGFSADIFMGLYDDAKYKAEVKAKFDTRRAEEGKKMPEALDKIVKDVSAIDSLPALELTYYSVFGRKTTNTPPHADLKHCTAAQFEYVQLAFKKRKAELTPADAPEKDLADHA